MSTTSNILAALLVASAVTASQSATARPDGIATEFPGVRAPVTLTTSIYSIWDRGQDHDGDDLLDELEGDLAEYFRPYVIFDSDETATRSDEPIALFQVRPAECFGYGCDGAWEVTVKYAFLWAFDGGYGPSSDCSDAHWGDNQSITLRLLSYDEGRTWELPDHMWADVGVEQADLGPYWSPPKLRTQSHGDVLFPYVFLSAGKHHMYVGTSFNHQDAPASDWGCNDDVNGHGDSFYVDVSGSSDQFGWVGSNSYFPFHAYNNVGEPESHDERYFIGDLSQWYPWANSIGVYEDPPKPPPGDGEHAWSGRPFLGGAWQMEAVTSSLNSMWRRDRFYQSDDVAGHFASRIMSIL